MRVRRQNNVADVGQISFSFGGDSNRVRMKDMNTMHSGAVEYSVIKYVPK